MRLTQFRIHAHVCADGMVAIALLKVHYEHGKIKEHELVLNDWCEAGQLEAVVTQFMGQLAASAYRTAAELNPVLPI